MAKRLYVGNLPFNLSLEELKNVFGVHGEISEATIVTDKFNGKSKGFGFITFVEDANADKAMAEMNGKDVGGRKLTVNEAKPFDENRPKREGGFRRSGGFGGGRGGGFGGNGGGRFQRRDRDY